MSDQPNKPFSSTQDEFTVGSYPSLEEINANLSSLAGQPIKNQPISERGQLKQNFSFEEDLWDSLIPIQANTKRGTQHLYGLSHFCRNYTKVLQNLSHGMHKCSETFEREMQCSNGYDTTTIAISGLKRGIDDFVLTVQDKINMVIGDLIEPLDLFYKQYIQSSNEELLKAKGCCSNLGEQKTKVLNSKQRYFKYMQDVEQSELAIEQALLEHEKGQMTLDQVQKITNQTLNTKYKAEISYQDYKLEVNAFNKQLAIFKQEYKPILAKLQQQEESRINFLKYNFEKFIKHFSGLGKSVVDKSAEMASQISMINSDTDIKIFIDEHKTHNQLIEKEEFMPFEQSLDVKQQKTELIQQINQQKQSSVQSDIEQESNENKILRYLHCLIKGQDISFDEKTQIIAYLHDSSVREVVAEFLQGINSPKLIENAEALKTFGELIKYLLTAFVHEKDDNFRVIYAILHSSQYVFYVKTNEEESERQKVFLTHYLNDHGIWQEQQLWKNCIQKIINQKFKEEVKSPGALAAKSQILQSQANLQGGLLGASLDKLKGALWGQGYEAGNKKRTDSQVQQDDPSSPMRIPKTLAQNIIFNSLSKFLYHFLNFQLSFVKSRDIVLHFCEKYQLDKNRTHLLLSELESIQKKARSGLDDQDLRDISLYKRQKRIDKYGKGVVQIIVQSLKFIGEDKAIRNLLCLNRQTYNCIRNRVYKQALLYSQPERLVVKRRQIWINLLKIVTAIINNIVQNCNKRDYNAFREKVAKDNKIIQNVEEVINMDVQRSFTQMKELDPLILTNILKTYAFFNPEIEYCQGMNFVAGYLYLFFKDEEVAFKALQEMVDKFDMAQLFNSELPKLKLFFYQLDRLLSVWVPTLHSHLKDEMINSSYYSSPWFITIFTNSLQNQEGGSISQKQHQLWDYFLTVSNLTCNSLQSGWKAIFRMGLYVMKEHEKELLGMNFEQILNFITEKPKLMLSECCDNVTRENLIYQLLKKSSKGKPDLSFLLQRLEQEFNNSLAAAQMSNNQARATQKLKSVSRQPKNVLETEEEKKHE